MTTGTHFGMAFSQDAACSANVIAVQSNGSFDHGMVYAPTALIDLQSRSSYRTFRFPLDRKLIA